MRTIALVFSLLFCFPVLAQRIVGGSGAAGIVILWEGNLPKNQAFSIKRRDVGTAEYTYERNSRLAQTLKDVRENLNQTPTLLREALTISDSMAQFLLQKVQSLSSVEDLPLGNASNVQIALGLGFVDTTVVSGKSYEYVLEIDGRPMPEKLRILHTPEAKRISWIPKAYKSSTLNTQVKCSWQIPADKRQDVYSFLVFRSEAFKLNYKPIKCIKGFTGNADTLLAIIRDSSLTQAGVWHYVIRTMDRFGALGPLSEYQQVDNFPPNTEPFMPFLEAKGETGAPFIQLKWRLQHAERVKSLALYRSRHASKDFQMIGYFPPTDSTLRDQVTDVMESYFYYFEIYDIARQQPLRSPMVTSVSKYQPVAMPPKNVQAENIGENIRITWETAGSQARGFYVWKTEGFNDKLELVSEFIPFDSRTATLQWIDSAATLRGDRIYTYAIMSESDGYLKSELSETVQIQAKRKVFLSTPNGLYLIKMEQQAYRLFWKDLSETTNRLAGYRIYLQKNGRFEALSDSVVPLEQNWYDLTNVKHGDSISITAVGLYGAESAFALPVAVHDPMAQNFGPRHLKCYNENDGIRLTWNRSSGITLQRYRLYRSKDNEKPALLQSLSADLVDFTDKSVQKGETYFYFIVGEDANGNLSNASVPTAVSR